MPLVATPFELPADTREVRAGDVDGDGRDDLVVVSRTVVRAGVPESVKLTILSLGDTGAVTKKQEVDLGTRALLWDVDHGVWLLDGTGLVRHGAEQTRIKFPTALQGLSPASPRHADLTHDLDGDGVPELVAWSAGRYVAYRADGGPLGSVAAPAEGTLGGDWETGGARTSYTLTPPPLAVADLDGDGRRDLLLPSGATLAAYFTGDNVGARAATIPLPLDLEPREEDPKPGETRRRVSAVWLDDIDGDGRTDLGVQRTVLAGTWWGATAELSWAKGRGDGFGPLATIPVNAAAFGVELVDLDGDRDKDFVAPVVDVGIGTVARALVAKSARVDLSLFRNDAGTFATPAKVLRVFAFPLEQPDRFQGVLDADVDGDGRLDLVTNDGEDRVRVYRGVSGGLEATPAHDTPVRVPVADDTLFVHDLTGDGRAEIVVWGPGERTGTVLRLP